MKKAVIYGGGNIGRGFIGTLFANSGYSVTFIDVSEKIVGTLNEQHQYPVRIVSNQGFEDIRIHNVDAVHGHDTRAVAKAIAEADIMATAVGVNVLKFIIPNLVAGLRERFAKTDRPLNIIICENLMNADKILAGMIKADLKQTEHILFEERVGLIEASIGRMVPVQTSDMQDGEPLRVCVEQYGFLPVDQAAFKGDLPTIKNMIPFEPFDFYIKRKLYVHNMGHAVCAYLGGYVGLSFIFESIDVADTRIIVQNAMLESSLALSRQYHVPLEDILLHVDDLLFRFTNAALKDTCERVGGDPKRKLSSEDRLIGSAQLCLKQGIYPAYISIGIAGAIYRYISENYLNQTKEQAISILEELSDLTAETELTDLVLEMYTQLLMRQSIADLRRVAQLKKAGHSLDIV